MTRVFFARHLRRSFLLMLLVGGCVLAWSGGAAACGNAVRFALDPVSQMISKSEKRLQKGKFASAYGQAREAHKILTKAEGQRVPNRDQVRVLRYRTERIMAIAVVRMKGTAHLPKGRVKRKVSEANRERNLHVAVKMLVNLREYLHDTPKFAAHVAEGQLVFEESRDEGAKVLEELARDDLLPDAWAYRALALARHRSGDVSRRDKAVEECKKRAKKKSTCDDFLSHKERRDAAAKKRKKTKPRKAATEGPRRAA
jgi:hypothetical protein